MGDAPVSLSKVSLTKRGETVSLEKRSQGFGDIEINLNWAQAAPPPAPSGLLSMFRKAPQAKSVDLDLGCLFEMQDGSKGVVQALGDTFGDLSSAPYIMLDGDDRTGANAAGETIRINGRHWSELKRALVFAFIYDGVANWRDTDGVGGLHSHQVSTGIGSWSASASGSATAAIAAGSPSTPSAGSRSG